MRDLEGKILRWRKQMLVGGIKKPVLLDELEAHLRDEFESQIKRGLLEADAFAAAVQKIGGVRPLREEFDKVVQARRAREEKLRQRFALVILVAVGLFAGACALFRFGTCSQMTFAQQMSSLMAILLGVALGFVGLCGSRVFPVIDSQQTRKMVGIIAVGLWVLWESAFFFVILQRSDFDMGELVTTFYWAFLVPIGFVLGLVTGIENSARKSMAAEAR